MQSVVDHSLKNFEAKYRYFAEQIDLMDSLFKATFSPLVRKERREKWRAEKKLERRSMDSRAVSAIISIYSLPRSRTHALK